MLLQLLDRELDRPNSSSYRYYADLVAWVHSTIDCMHSGDFDKMQVQASAT